MNGFVDNFTLQLIPMLVMVLGVGSNWLPNAFLSDALRPIPDQEKLDIKYLVTLQAIFFIPLSSLIYFSKKLVLGQQFTSFHLLSLSAYLAWYVISLISLLRLGPIGLDNASLLRRMYYRLVPVVLVLLSLVL